MPTTRRSRARVAAAATAALLAGAGLAACAKGDTTGDVSGGGDQPDAAGVHPDAASSRDTSPPPPPMDAGGDDASGGDAGGCTKVLVINEVATHGTTASVEFVELFNPNGCAVSLAGWKLAYKSRTNGAGPDLYTFQAGDSIAAKAYFVLGSTSYTGTKNATMSGGISDDGQVGLSDEKAKLVDAVGFGAATGDFVEKAAAPSQTSDTGSVARIPNGADTNDNKADFEAVATSTPGAAN